MKKWWARLSRLGVYWCLVIAVAIYTLAYWRPGLPVTHDGENHVARFAQYYLSLRQGQFPPRLAPNLENGYGYPVFNYNYPLANLLSLPASIAHVHYETTFKLIIAFSLLLGLISCWRWWEYLFPERRDWWWTLIAFLVMPYLWMAIWYRGNIGEAMIYLLLPVVGWQIERYRAGRPLAATTMLLSLTAFFLCHNVMVLFLSPVVAGYAISRLWVGKSDHAHANFSWFSGKFQLFGQSKIVSGAVLALLALGLSAWFWGPALGEKHLVVLDTAGLNQEYVQHFVTWRQLLRPGVTSGLSYPGSVDGLGFGLGWCGLGIVGLTGCGLLSHRRERFYYPGLSVVLLILILFTLWVQTRSSLWLWSHLPLVHFIQFPWRLGLLAQFLAVLLVANYRFSGISGKTLGVILLTGQAFFLFLGPPTQFFTHTRDDYLTYPMSTTTSREDTPVTFAWDISAGMPREPQIATGSGQLAQVTRLDTTRKDYQVTCQDRCLVLEHTARFPGFQTWVDGVPVAYVDDDQIQGRIAFWLDPGDHVIRTAWGERTLVRLISDAITLICLLATVGIGGQEWRCWRAQVKRWRR